MKKIILSLFTLLNLSFTLAQFQPTDTLYANKHQIVSLVFDSPIERAITGAKHFVFTHNRETSDALGLLQAENGKESNLLVLTSDGSLYSFVLAYRNSLTVVHHFVNSSKSLKKPSNNRIVKPKIKAINNHYDKLCKQLLTRTRQFHQIQTNGSIRLKMTESIYHDKEVYVVYELQNTSAIDYEIDQMILYKVLGNLKRRASYQEIAIKPLHSFQMPKIVPQGNTIRFVMVYPKFTLSKYQDLIMDLKEKNGQRNFLANM